MRTFFTDGLKNIELPQYPDSAWTFKSNPPDDVNMELWANVAAVYRVVQMTADAIAGMPFAFVMNKQDWDVSDDYQNKLGWLPNPQEMFRLWRQSLFMTNEAYGFMESGPRKLRYIVQDTIEPVVSAAAGVVAFRRTLDNRTTEYPYQQGSPKNRIIPIWRQDFTTELLPSKNTELNALIQSAGILFYTDFFVRDFYKRGGVIPSIIGVKGVTNQVQQEKVERAFDKLIRNIYKYVAQVWNAEAVTVTPLGQGVESLQKTTLYENALSNVAMAAGMPLSLLLSNSANYATAREEKLTWFNNSIVPYSTWFAEVMNRELFEPYGVKIDFRPELTDEGQEDEVMRADAFSKYVSAGVPKSVAAQIVGIELPADMEFEDLDEEEEPEEPEVTEMPMQPQEDVEDEPLPVRALTIDELNELRVWRDVALRKAKKSEDITFAYEYHYGGLPEDIETTIKSRLSSMTDITPDNIKAAFSVEDLITVTEPQTYERADQTDIKMLADALNRVADAEVKTHYPTMPNWVLNMPPITVNTPEQKVTVNPELKADFPTVTVNVPEQAAPVVNVVNEVQTPVVNVTNDVQPAPVTIKPPTSAKVIRNGEGRIEGIESK